MSYHNDAFDDAGSGATNHNGNHVKYHANQAYSPSEGEAKISSGYVGSPLPVPKVSRTLV